MSRRGPWGARALWGRTQIARQSSTILLDEVCSDERVLEQRCGAVRVLRRRPSWRRPSWRGYPEQFTGVYLHHRHGRYLAAPRKSLCSSCRGQTAGFVGCGRSSLKPPTLHIYAHGRAGHLWPVHTSWDLLSLTANDIPCMSLVFHCFHAPGALGPRQTCSCIRTSCQNMDTRCAIASANGAVFERNPLQPSLSMLMVSTMTFLALPEAWLDLPKCCAGHAARTGLFPGRTTY